MRFNGFRRGPIGVQRISRSLHRSDWNSKKYDGVRLSAKKINGVQERPTDCDELFEGVHMGFLSQGVI